MSKTLYPSIYLPGVKSASVFLHAGADIIARPFTRNVFKPKITNWRIPDQTSDTDFDFVDGTDFDFVDGTDFDFVG